MRKPFGVLGLVAMLALLPTAPAMAATYLGHQIIGGADVNFSITTNGAVGLLTANDIAFYSVSVAGAGGGYAFSGTGASGAMVTGSSFFATPTSLDFNHDAAPTASQAVFQGGPQQYLTFSSAVDLGSIFIPGYNAVKNGVGSLLTTNKTGLEVIALLQAFHPTSYTYTGHEVIQGAVVDTSITTNGTTGALKTSDITAYTVSVTGLNGDFTFSGATGLGALIHGSQLVALPDSLLFNFSGSTATNDFTLQGENPFQLLRYTAEVDFGTIVLPGSIVIRNGKGGNLRAITVSGLRTIGYNLGGVPEPATWGTMAMGLGIVGAAIRRGRWQGPRGRAAAA